MIRFSGGDIICAPSPAPFDALRRTHTRLSQSGHQPNFGRKMATLYRTRQIRIAQSSFFLPPVLKARCTLRFSTDAVLYGPLIEENLSAPNLSDSLDLGRGPFDRLESRRL